MCNCNEKTVVDEETVIGLIVSSGEAKSCAMEAIAMARKGEFESAEEMLSNSKRALNEAHLVQTKLIESDAGEGKIQVSLVLVHAQDHLMNSILCLELANELYEIHKQLKHG